MLNNVNKFHKILIKKYLTWRADVVGQTYVRTSIRTGVTLNAPAIVMAGAIRFCLI